MYPQTVVPSDDDLHTTLTNGSLGLNEDVKATGEHYTANKDDIGWNPNDQNPNYSQELNPVYEYQGKRYVRVTPYRYDANSYYNDRVANPENIEQVIAAAGDGAAAPRWFKVEPIKWIILNFNQLIVKNDNDIVTDLPILNKDIPMELYAADVLIGGLAFNSEGNTLWANSDINTYLNSRFYDEAFSLSEADMIQTSTIYNNTSSSDYNNPIYNLNANHLTDGSGMNQTDQKIYLLSRYEMSNPDSPYVKKGVFASGTGATTKRLVSGTDYARAHYMYLSAIDGKSFARYWTRTANSSTGISLVSVDNPGGIVNGNATYVYYGTRPALTMVCFALQGDLLLGVSHFWECTHKP